MNYPAGDTLTTVVVCKRTRMTMVTELIVGNMKVRFGFHRAARVFLAGGVILAGAMAASAPASAYTSRQLKDVENFTSVCRYQGGTIEWRTDSMGVTSVTCFSADGLSFRTYVL